MKKKIFNIGKTIIIVAGGTVAFLLYKKNTVEKAIKKVDKFKTYYNMLNGWLSLKQDGKSLATWFESTGYETIAIYGMGEMGNRLYEELRDTNIKVAYAIDQNSDSIYSELSIYQKEDNYPKVDAIVVSAVFAFDEISVELKKQCHCPVISLEDIVYGV